MSEPRAVWLDMGDGEAVKMVAVGSEPDNEPETDRILHIRESVLQKMQEEKRGLVDALLWFYGYHVGRFPRRPEKFSNNFVYSHPQDELDAAVTFAAGILSSVGVE